MNDTDFSRRKKLVLDFMAEPKYVPMKLKELYVMLQVAPDDRQKLIDVLEELLSEGRIEVSKRGKYSIAKERVYEGIFTGHQDGFGFVAIEGREEDLFIPEDETGTALHGDTVRVKLILGHTGKRQSAAVTEIIKRSETPVVGYYEKEAGKGYGFVIPDNRRIAQDIFIEDKNAAGAVNGEKVCVSITVYPDSKIRRGKNPEGIITERLGMYNEKGVDVLSIIKTAGFSEDFPEEVKTEAKDVALPVSDITDREDFRDVLMVTIDGEDAKDLDDAVSLYMDGDRYVLGVHIADVTHYVKEYSSLDKEALKRATSVYLVDRVLPMLPVELSNGCCSLNAGEDRYALSCVMVLDKKGKVLDSKIAKGVIRVDRRMSYTEVNAIIGEGDNPQNSSFDIPDELRSMLLSMDRLAGILRKNRFKKGSIDFDFPETKVVLDDAGHPVKIMPYERNSATKLIEEFMLMANKCVAQTMYYLEIPFVYRTHEAPDNEKLLQLMRILGRVRGIVDKSGVKSDEKAKPFYSIHLGGDEVHPGEIQKLLNSVEDSPYEPLIARLTLRSMKKAKYTTECTGHFGLSFEFYTHFTSPIRRYPDLQIHRIIKEHLSGTLNEKRLLHYEKILKDVAKQSSDREVAAAEAERETVKLKKAEYMLQRIGEEYDGVVSGVAAYGLYVELSNSVEGLIHISKLEGDYFKYSEADFALYGETTGRIFTIGQKIKVRCAGADKVLGTVDFDYMGVE